MPASHWHRPEPGLPTLVPVAFVGVDAPDDDVVLEHHCRCEVCGGVTDGPAARTDAGKADEAATMGPPVLRSPHIGPWSVAIVVPQLGSVANAETKTEPHGVQ